MDHHLTARVEQFFPPFVLFMETLEQVNKIKLMETQFYIEFRLKTGSNWESFAKFYIGNDRKQADAIFKKLQGMEANEKSVLQIDFTETIRGLPVNLNMLTCTLDQLAENCKCITKELFKLKNLEVS